MWLLPMFGYILKRLIARNVEIFIAARKILLPVFHEVQKNVSSGPTVETTVSESRKPKTLFCFTTQPGSVLKKDKLWPPSTFVER